MSSEHLASAQTELKGDLGASWNILDGASANYTDLGIAGRFGGASAAYSLRDIGAMNGSVVRARREPYDTTSGIDDEERFSANQVQDGTLEKWVNGKLETTLPADVATAAAAYSLRKVKDGPSLVYTADFSSGTDGLVPNSTSLFTSVGGFTYEGKSNVALFTSVNSPSNPQLWLNNNDFLAGFSGSITFEYYVESDSPLVGNKWVVGSSIATYTKDGVTIVGGAWTTATVFFGSYYSGTDKYKIETGIGEVGRILNAVDSNNQSVNCDVGEIVAFSSLTASVISPSAQIRRSSDDIEVNVHFDSDGNVSNNSLVSNVGEETTGSSSASTSVTDLNGFLNETLSDRFSAVDYPSGIGSDFRKWSTLTATSNSFVATTETFADNTARYNYVLPATLTAAESASTTFRFSGTVNYTASGGTGFNIKQGSNDTASSTHDFANLTSTGVGTISSDTFKFSNGDSGDFSFEFTGNGSNDFRSIVFLQTIVSSGSSSISLTNLKFEIIKHGATVHTWYDQAGSNNATQTTAANQPKIAENGALLSDGIDFDGSDDFLLADDLQSIYTGTDAVSSAFIVVNSDAASTTQYIIGAGNAGLSSPMYNTLFHSSGNLGWQARDNSATLKSNLTATPYIANKMYLVSNINSGTTTDFNSNAVIIDNGADSDVGDKSIGTVKLGARGNGASSPLNGSMKEAIFYATDQSDNRFKIESNINNYYGLYNDANDMSTDWSDDPTAPYGSAFTSNGKDGYTIDYSAGVASTRARWQFEQNVPSGKVVYYSFNASITSGTPAVILKQSDGTSNANSSSVAITNGFNSGSITTNATAVYFAIGDTEGTQNYSISDFKVSRIARDGFVETWYDQSDSGNDATQTTASEQPLIVYNGGIVKNSEGKPSLNFIPSSDHLDVPAVIDNINTVSTFVVFERDVNSGNGTVAGQLGSSSSTSRFYTPIFTGSIMYFGYGDSATKINMGSYDANRTYLASFVTGDTNAEAFLDNVSKGTTAVQSAAIDATNGAIARNVRSLSSFPWDGRVSEVIYYKAKLQDDVADLNTDINNHYNIY